MYTPKEIKKFEKLAKEYEIEIIAVCKKCGEHWATIKGFEIVRICQTCKTGQFITHYAELIDTFEAIELLNKRTT